MIHRLLLSAILLPILLSTSRDFAAAQEGDVPGRIAYVRADGIWAWENGDSTQLLEQEDVADARWSPNGETMLFVENGNSYSDLALLDLQTGFPRLLTNNQSASEMGSELYVAESVWVMDPAWSTSGTIGFVSENPETGLFSLWLMEGPDGVAYPTPIDLSEDIDSVSLSSDATFAAFVLRERRGDGTKDTTVYLGDLATGEVFLAAQSSGEVFDPAISPDGTQIAIAVREAGGRTDIWIVDRATLDRRRVTRDAEALAPAWSPDGRWLAFMRMEDYQFDVWVAPVADGEAGDPFKLFSEQNMDSRSGLSWWAPPGAADD